MSVNLIPAQPIEVPLPADYQNQQCLPLVVMQPDADMTNYMLKSTYATNGQPGVVDHAVLADTATTVLWGNITNLPTVFPPSPHAPSHLQNGNDSIPIATVLLDGLMPAGSGHVLDYMGGDINWHPLPGVLALSAEGPVSITPGDTAGAQLLSTAVVNPSSGIYLIRQCYLYKPNLAFPVQGTVHFEVWDSGIPGWVQVTASTDISVMTNKESLLSLVLTSGAMTQVFPATPNAFAWRVILDVATGQSSYFQAGIIVGLATLTALT